MEFHFASLHPQNWSDFETLFGPRGACGGCWCMHWRTTSSEYNRLKGKGNRDSMKKLVTTGQPLGVIAYSGQTPAGWCSVSPRSSLIRLAGSRILKPLDNQPVWSITCLYIDKAFRRQGLSPLLISEAVRYAQNEGAKIIEAYPVEATGKAMPDVFAFTGLASAFAKAGFKEVARRSATRPIMRFA